MKILDALYGVIEFDEKFERAIGEREIQSLKTKSQLGLTALGDDTGGNGTRYAHSIGAYYTAKYFLCACQKLLDKIGIEIPMIEKVAFLLSAVCHDIGHKGYSHLAERVRKRYEELYPGYKATFHEEETYLLLENGPLYDHLVEIFGKEVVNKACAILKGRDEVKKSDTLFSLKFLNFRLIFAQVASGTIDFDRIDYLQRDKFYLTGQRLNFLPIFDGMDIDLVDGDPQVVFDYTVLPLIEQYLITRFDMYNTHYFHPKTVIREEYFINFMIRTFSIHKIKNGLSEAQINYTMETFTSADPITRRYMDVSRYSIDNDVKVKSFDTQQEQRIFRERLEDVLGMEPDSSYFFEMFRKVVIYNPSKHRIYIKKGNEIKHITQISKVIGESEISKETIISSIDMVILEHFLREKGLPEADLKKILKSVSNIFDSTDMEIEKKYVFEGEFDKEAFESILSSLDYELKQKQQVENVDQYYVDQYGIFRRQKVNLRRRNGEEYTLKFSAQDDSSLTKRYEYSSNKLEGLFPIITDKLGIDASIQDYVAITTKRIKYKIIWRGSIIEVSLDFSVYSYKGNEKTDFMIETELKSGSALTLYLLGLLLKKGLENIKECNISKLERAEMMLGIN